MGELHAPVEPNHDPLRVGGLGPARCKGQHAFLLKRNLALHSSTLVRGTPFKRQNSKLLASRVNRSTAPRCLQL